MRRHPLLTFALASLALFAGAAAAVAAPASHAHHITGRVVAINVRRHTLRLRVVHARRASAAAVGGGPVVVVAFGSAAITGPDGAVAVGDEITVTTQTTPGGGQAAVASSIQVIGQPNGGDAGKGAAVPGEVTAVDPAAGTLMLAVTA